MTVDEWRCFRCKAPPIEINPSTSPDLMVGTCSNYQCPSRAPRRKKMPGGWHANNPGQSTFTRKRS